MANELQLNQAVDGASTVGEIDADAHDALDALKTVKKFIFSDLSPDTAALIEAWPDLDEYVLELCGDTLEHLSREPASLAVQEERYLTQLEDVSCGNYRALIEGFECAGAVRQHVGRVRGGLDALLDALPELARATRAFSKDVGTAQRARERQLRTAQETGRVLDLLEMPRLMRSLLQGELYDEALALREHAAKLRLLHARQPLVASVCRSIDALTVQMVAQLLAVLRAPVQLTTCMRVVGWLRRLDVYPECTLRIQFLHYRGQCMRAQVRAALAHAATPQARLVALCDATRAAVFEIVTQYRAVFADSADELSDDVTAACADADPNAILYDWTSRCVQDFLDRLESGLRSVTDGAALRTVLQQAMACGQSLGRVGADFRAVLPPLFHAAVSRIYAVHLSAARTQFEAMLEDGRWAPVGSSAKDDKVNGANEAAAEEVGDTQYEPPRAVLDSPPLAVFLNGILAALNDLRLCAPKSLGPQLGAMLEQTFIEAAQFMSGVAGPGGVFLKRTDRNHFKAMITSLRDLALPHAARCLDLCMGQTSLLRVDHVTEELTSTFGVDAPADVRAMTSPVVQPNAINGTKTIGTEAVRLDGDTLMNSSARTGRGRRGTDGQSPVVI